MAVCLAEAFPSPRAGGDLDGISLLCPCGEWQLLVPLDVDPVELKIVLRSHLRHCVILGAAKLMALARS